MKMKKNAQSGKRMKRGVGITGKLVFAIVVSVILAVAALLD